MYEFGYKPTKSQMFARQICRIALMEWDVPIERLSQRSIELIADNALQRFPSMCDGRYRNLAIGRVRVLQRRLE